MCALWRLLGDIGRIEMYALVIVIIIIIIIVVVVIAVVIIITINFVIIIIIIIQDSFIIIIGIVKIFYYYLEFYMRLTKKQGKRLHYMRGGKSLLEDRNRKMFNRA